MRYLGWVGAQGCTQKHNIINIWQKVNYPFYSGTSGTHGSLRERIWEKEKRKKEGDSKLRIQNLNSHARYRRVYFIYAVERKPLRVTWPKKDKCQWSTYRLCITYCYSIPLLATYTTLPWLILPSPFFVAIEPYGLPPISVTETLTRQSYSPIAVDLC